jgi:hypothetical protein
LPPTKPMEGLKRMPQAPPQIRRNAQRYRNDRRRNLTAAP